MQLQVGQRIRAKQDRILEFAGYDPFTMWRQGQVLWVQGIFQSQPGSTRDLMICLDEQNFENVPEPIFDELFDLVE